ncbi:hypothetical protein ACIQ7N_15400 [Lysinibacillus sp. NPDC095746]
MDEESDDKELLRSKMQTLSLSATTPREESEVYVRDWLKHY